ncbi:DUF4190 domain-containing protein [Demequina sp. NBRC 110057]|uniref:DUF4190 domain-containing protein n=1 Tax=Demequina sp. NBRC 110057 TaxID=1570346 RepID=UPI0009FBB0F0|nr:DUF4190 domain-containing protein [Demequina sp. NBRC 110057]
MTDTDPFKNPSSGSRSDVPVTEPMPVTPAPYGQEPAPSWAPQADAGSPGYTQHSYGQADASASPYAAPAGQPGPYVAPPMGDASQYGTTQYGSAPYGTPSQQRGTDGVSIAALVTGLLSLAFVAIVLGAMGLRRTAQGARKGTWMAVTGLVLGILGTIAWTAVITGAIVASLDVADRVQETIEDGDWGSDYYNSDAQAYGDDPTLDALYDQCGAGDDAACDELYWSTTTGTEYEEFALDCGGRGMPTGQWYCDPESQW